MASNVLWCFAKKFNFLNVGVPTVRPACSALSAFQTRGYAKKVGKYRVHFIISMFILSDLDG